MFETPQRAHSLIVSVGADTAEDLAAELNNMAWRILTGKMTQGVMGGSSVGSHYSYKVQPEMTHDAYFEAIDKYLAEQED